MIRIITYKGCRICKESNLYNIHDNLGYWRGVECTLAFAKQAIDEIMVADKLQSELETR